MSKKEEIFKEGGEGRRKKVEEQQLYNIIHFLARFWLTLR